MLKCKYERYWKMGITIDDSRESAPMSRKEIVENLKTMVFGVQAFDRFNAKERETLDKAWNIIDQYENRLKADLVAMLTELQLEIEELENPLDYDFEGYNQCAVDCEKLIQQKIDKLKEAKDGENND